MTTGFSRRELVAAGPVLGLATILPATVAKAAPTPSPPPAPQHYRIDEPAKIIAVAREIVLEDWVATFITVDSNGVPRARSVGVWDPDPDLTLWISTRRGSRPEVKTRPA